MSSAEVSRPNSQQVVADASLHPSSEPADFSVWRSSFISSQRTAVVEIKKEITECSSQIDSIVSSLATETTGFLRLKRLVKDLKGSEAPESAQPEIRDLVSELLERVSHEKNGALRELRRELNEVLAEKKLSTTDKFEKASNALSDLALLVEKAALNEVLPGSRVVAFAADLRDLAEQVGGFAERLLSAKSPPADNAFQFISDNVSGALTDIARALKYEAHSPLGNIKSIAAGLSEALASWPRGSSVHGNYSPLQSLLLRYTAHCSAYDPSGENTAHESAISDIEEQLLKNYGTRQKEIWETLRSLSDLPEKKKSNEPGDDEKSSDKGNLPVEIAGTGQFITASTSIARAFQTASENTHFLHNNLGLFFEVAQKLAFSLGNRDFQKIKPLLNRCAELNNSALKAVLNSIEDSPITQDSSRLEAYLGKFIKYLEQYSERFDLISCNPVKMPQELNTAEKLDEKSKILERCKTDLLFEKHFKKENFELEVRHIIVDQRCPPKLIDIVTAVLLQKAWWENSDSVQSKLFVELRKSGYDNNGVVNDALDWLQRQKFVLCSAHNSRKIRLNTSPKKDSGPYECLQVLTALVELENPDRGATPQPRNGVEAMHGIYNAALEALKSKAAFIRLKTDFHYYRTHTEQDGSFSKALLPRARIAAERIANQNLRSQKSSAGRNKKIEEAVISETGTVLKEEAKLLVKKALAPLSEAISRYMALEESDRLKGHSELEERLKALSGKLNRNNTTFDSIYQLLGEISNDQGVLESLKRSLGDLVKVLPLSTENEPDTSGQSVQLKAENLTVLPPSFRFDYDPEQKAIIPGSRKVDPALTGSYSRKIVSSLFKTAEETLEPAPTSESPLPSAEILRKALSDKEGACFEIDYEKGSVTIELNDTISQLNASLPGLVTTLEKLASSYPHCQFTLDCTPGPRQLFKTLKSLAGEVDILSFDCDSASKTVTVTAKDSRAFQKHSTDFLKETGWKIQARPPSAELQKVLGAVSPPLDPWENLSSSKRLGDYERTSTRAIIGRTLGLGRVEEVENFTVITTHAALPENLRKALSVRLARLGTPVMFCVDQKNNTGSAEVALATVEKIVRRSLPEKSFLRSVKNDSKEIEVSVFSTGAPEDSLKQLGNELSALFRLRVNIKSETPTDPLKELLETASPVAAFLLPRLCERDGTVGIQNLTGLESIINRVKDTPTPREVNLENNPARKIHDSIVIDHEQTRIREDAFSVSRIKDGWRIEVHLLDLSSALPYGSSADHFARRIMYRSGTEGHQETMISRDYLVKHASFTPTSYRPAWTIGFEVTDQGVLRQPFSLEFTQVKVSDSLSYSDADRILSSNSGHNRELRNRLNMLASAASRLHGRKDQTYFIRSSKKIVGELLEISDQLLSEVLDKKGLGNLLLATHHQTKSLNGVMKNDGYNATLRRAARDYAGLFNQHILKGVMCGGPRVWSEDIKNVASEMHRAEDERRFRERDHMLVDKLKMLRNEAGYITPLRLVEVTKDGEPIMDLTPFSLKGSRGILKNVRTRGNEVILASGETLRPGDSLPVQLIGFDTTTSSFLVASRFKGLLLDEDLAQAS